MSLSASYSASQAMLEVRNELAPIALFVYNRPEHTERTVISLQANDLASRSDLFIFSDGAKDEANADAVRRVRSYIRGIAGFSSVTVIERSGNLGLAGSVLSGITQLCGDYGRMIALEDDLLTSPDFLTFMNRALVRYKDEPRVFSVSGFNFALKAPENFPYDAFCFYRSSSLGWGTWNDRWKKADWLVSDYSDFIADEKRQKQFHRAGEDLTRMLRLQMTGKIDSWAIRWVYAHYQHDGLALLSLVPRVFHFGDDGSGTNTHRGALPQLPLSSDSKSEFQFPTTIEAEQQFAAELQRSLRPSLARKIVRHFRDRLK
jgi:hypothetical protein